MSAPMTLSRDSDEAEIRRLVKDFAVATDYVDTRTLVELLCAEEAEGVTDSAWYNAKDPDTMGPVIMPDDWQPASVETSEVRVVGDVASARVTRDGRSFTLYFRKEDGRWKVCAPAAYQMPPA
jgi:hypothetical protein